MKICPLKKGWSASIAGGKIQSYTKEQIISGVRVAKVADKETPPQKTPEEDKKVIEKLEERIAKMDKKSKGINIKGVKVTSGVKEWAKKGIQDRWDDITGAVIHNLLREALFDGFIRCRKCGNRIEPDAKNCYCGWENPLVSEGLI